MPNTGSHRTAYLNGRLVERPTRETLQAILADRQGLVWLDVTAPTEADERLLREVFGLHPLALEDAVKAGQRAKVEHHENHYFAILYAAVEIEGEPVELRPVHLFIGATFLVTVHAKPIPQIDETVRRWQAEASPLTSRAGAVGYALLDAIVDDYFPIMDRIAEEVDAVEDAAFEAGADVVATVFRLKKELLRLRRRIAPERDILNAFMRRELPVFEPADVPYLQDVYDHLIRLTENIDLYRELLASVLDVHLSSQSNRLNQIVKVLTVASIILMTNALVAGIYGMNFAHMPELRWAYGYPFALGLMAVLTVGLVVFFRKRKWV